MWWNLVITFLINVAISLLTPKNKGQDRKPAGIDEFNFPTNSRSRSIPVLWGTREIKGANIIWYGDLASEEVTKEVDSGLWSSEDVKIADRYSLGFQLALCHGGNDPVEFISRIRVDNKVAWNWDDPADETTGLTHEEEGLVYKPDMFGGEEKGGGVAAFVKMYAGTDAQGSDDYLMNHQDPCIPHKNIAYFVWKGSSAGRIGAREITLFGRKKVQTGGLISGFITQSTSVPPIYCTVTRRPNSLGVSSNKHKIGMDANPACMLWELYTNTEWGMGYPDSAFNRGNFVTVAEKLFDEKFGLSMIWDDEKSIEDVATDILRHIDAAMATNMDTGELELRLLRNDYDSDTIPHWDSSVVLADEDFGRGSWGGTINEIIVEFTNAAQNYETDSTYAQDLGNASIQNKLLSKTISYHGVSDADLANKLAYRELVGMTIPLTRVRVTCNRKAAKAKIGDPISLSLPEKGVEKMVMRVVDIDYGDFASGEITVNLVQDAFKLGDSIYANTGVTEGVDPLAPPEDVDEAVIFELPKYMATQKDDDRPEVMAMVPKRHGVTSLTPWMRATQNQTVPKDEDLFETPGVALPTPIGTLVGVYPAETETVDSVGVMVKMEFPVATNTSFGDRGMIWAGNVGRSEFMAYTGVSKVPGAKDLYIIAPIMRGLVDTTAIRHEAGAKLYFIGKGFIKPQLLPNFNQYVHAKFVANGLGGSTTLAKAKPFQTVVNYRRKERPLPVQNMRFQNKGTWPTTVSYPMRVQFNNVRESQYFQRSDTIATPASQDLQYTLTFDVRHYNNDVTGLTKVTNAVKGDTATWEVVINQSDADKMIKGFEWYPILGVSVESRIGQLGLQSIANHYRVIPYYRGTQIQYPNIPTPRGVIKGKIRPYNSSTSFTTWYD
jgi:hypothetical protein